MDPLVKPTRRPVARTPGTVSPRVQPWNHQPIALIQSETLESFRQQTNRQSGAQEWQTTSLRQYSGFSLPTRISGSKYGTTRWPALLVCPRLTLRVVTCINSFPRLKHVDCCKTFAVC